jgi:hypothetical protein
MAAVTRFDDLSPELVLCIFDFLSPADRYKSFFEYDYRLRVLVKKRTEFSRKKLNADILRFSTLHSWYKHFSFVNGGNFYFIVPKQGEQPRYSFDTCVTDSNGLHWWFICESNENFILNEHVRAIITRYPFRLNPFFYHDELKSSSRRSFYGGDLIQMKRKLDFQTWLSINYPEYVNKSEYISDSDLVPIFDGEWLKATTAIQKAAIEIWKELKELDDVNPLQLACKE